MTVPCPDNCQCIGCPTYHPRIANAVNKGSKAGRKRRAGWDGYIALPLIRAGMCVCRGRHCNGAHEKRSA